jgi:hypothetical protein
VLYFYAVHMVSAGPRRRCIREICGCIMQVLPEPNLRIFKYSLATKISTSEPWVSDDDDNECLARRASIPSHKKVVNSSIRCSAGAVPPSQKMKFFGNPGCLVRPGACAPSRYPTKSTTLQEPCCSSPQSLRLCGAQTCFAPCYQIFL